MTMGDKENFPNEIKQKMLSKDKELLNCRQKVVFGGEAAESHELCCTDVLVECSSGTHTSGSSNVKLSNIVDFNWELKNYPGHLIAVHLKGNFFAYGLKAMSTKGANSSGIAAGMVRVVCKSSGERALIRGIKGMVQDLAFSHLKTEVILASVDEVGLLMVHHIQEKESSPGSSKPIVCTLLLHVERETLPSPTDIHRIVWCPYIPEDNASSAPDPEIGELLVYTQGCHAEMWCIPLVNANFGVGPHKPSQVTKGLLTVPPLDSPITDAAFSPDGTALALATAGGLVSFFQVYMQTNSAPRCLHAWRPHGDKPLSTLWFLDNHENYSSEYAKVDSKTFTVETKTLNDQTIQFWKWAVTGAQDNSEIKLWTCDSWTCLQTINFQPSPLPLSSGLAASSGIQRCVLKAALDLSSKYIVLSDLYNRMLYVLNLHLGQGPAHVSIVSGFALPQPAISFGIFDAKLITPKPLHERAVDADDEDGEGEFESLGLGDGEPTSTVLLNMVVVQPKSLQECRVAFKLDPKPPTLSNDTLVFTEDTATNGKEKPTISTAAAAADLTKSPVTDTLNVSNSIINTSGSLNLMTPEAFSSPARHEDSPSRSSNVSSSGGSAKRISHTPPAPQAVPAPIELQQAVLVDTRSEPAPMMRDGGMASGGSSPSREVQQILALKEDCQTGDLVDDDFFETKDQPLIDIKQQSNDKIKPENGNAAYNWPQIPLGLLPLGEAQKPQKEQIVNQPCPPVIMPTNELVMELRSVQNCLQTFTMLLDQQQSEIKDLRSELKRLAPQRDNHEAMIATVVERVLSRQIQQQSQTLEKQMQDKITQLRDTLASAFTKSVDSIVTARLGKGFQLEVQNQILPVVLNTLQPLQDIMKTEVAQKLSTTDKLLQDNIMKLVTSKTIQDSISHSLVTVLQGTMSHCFREVMLTTVVPSFERTCKALFTQLDEAFAKGTREQLAAMEAQVEKQRKHQVEKTKDASIQFNAQVNAMNEAVRLGNEATATMVRKELLASVSQAVLAMQEALARSTREAVVEAVNKSMKENAVHSHPSRSETPLPHRADPQTLLASILGLVSQGQINNAFQMALSASDLTVVVMLCERVPAHKVFGISPCPLQQNVLLSLIQQLCAELGTKTEIKHKYLEEAVMNLDKDSPVVKEHMPRVLKDLQNKLTEYIQSNPSNSLAKSMRMLLMATKSLTKS